ncbi:MAG: hypothetical protein QOI55_2890 [Actinomycetota bacterium]|nr:hypothetical protein [Actinomycetota bacterium]
MSSWLARRRRRPEDEARSAWLDAAALLEARSRTDFKYVQEAHLTLVETLTDLRADLAQRDAQLTETLVQIGGVCSALTDRIEADREERTELVQTIAALASALVERTEIPAGRVIGGSVFGEPREDATDDPDDDVHHDAVDVVDVPGSTIDLFALELQVDAGEPVEAPHIAPSPGDEVRCRFGDRWVEGFEILEVHSREGRARCRVRRRSDGSVVRKLFEARDLEIVALAGKNGRSR